MSGYFSVLCEIVNEIDNKMCETTSVLRIIYGPRINPVPYQIVSMGRCLQWKTKLSFKPLFLY